MQPIRLSLTNFCSHSETEFSFDDFSSALIIGKVKNNDRFSNGSGKSTIFNAIEYVLFNEIHFSSLEKIIRDGCDIARVEFDFLSSLDKNTYRIVRSNSRKTGTDARLFKLVANNEWEDLTQRRVSDTEKEIVKIVGFNYKAFCASVLFSQAGSENNVQKDFGNLPALTPEKRKSILREVLQVNIYANYEKLAKNKYSTIQTSLDKQKIILSTLGDPENSLQLLSKQNIDLQKNIHNDSKSLNKIKVSLNNIKFEYTILSEKVSATRNKINEVSVKVNHCKEQIIRSDKTIIDLRSKISNLPDEAKAIQLKIDNISKNIDHFKKEKYDTALIRDEIEIINNKIIQVKVDINSIISNINTINNPIADDEICTKCHQSVSEEHKHSWIEKSKIDLLKYEELKDSLIKNLKNQENRKNELNEKISKIIKEEKQYNDLLNKKQYLSNDIENKRSLYKNYNSLIQEHLLMLTSKNTELDALQFELDKLILSDDKSIIQQLDALKRKLSNLNDLEFNLSDKLSNLVGEQAIIKHKIDECENNKVRIVALKSDIQEIEKSLLLHSKVIQAFGSNGIPALITHSILDELQEEANKWLLKLRPGLQLQFVVINDKNKKEQEDTLDILYFIDGSQKEYKQLSGAQKIIVSLSVKLGLLLIMNKRLGVDIKLILLDEVDQALDPGSTEIFADIIKVIQDEFKVMVITHNDNIKHKFSHALLVEQDENNISKGKLCVNYY